MGRCPIHSKYIQSGSTCMVWVCRNKWTDPFRCGHTLNPLSADELKEIRATKTKDAINKTTLPEWIVVAIKSIAHKQLHLCEETEVDDCIRAWIQTFEYAQNCRST